MVSREQIVMQVGAGAMVAAVILFQTKPSTMFDENGKPKKWDYWQQSSDTKQTAVPWWLAASATGLATPFFF